MVVKQTRFIKKKEVIGLLSSLGIRTHLNRIPLIGPLLSKRYKINKKKKIFLAGNKLIPERHLKELEFTYSAQFDYSACAHY